MVFDPSMGGLATTRTDSLSATGAPTPSAAPSLLVPQYNEKRLLELFDKKKRAAFEYRWIWEREWLRDIFYTTNRQWIYYHPTRREWIDKRLRKNIPRPVTNKMAEVVQTLRASFESIDLGIFARPIGYNQESVASAEITNDMSPLLHDEHQMGSVIREADFWFIVNGNAAIQVSWDTDKRFNRVFVPHEQCLQCGTVLPPVAIAQNNQMCPVCQGTHLVVLSNSD